jgi:hypothetical protein
MSPQSSTTPYGRVAQASIGFAEGGAATALLRNNTKHPVLQTADGHSTQSQQCRVQVLNRISVSSTSGARQPLITIRQRVFLGCLCMQVTAFLFRICIFSFTSFVYLLSL